MPEYERLGQPSVTLDDIRRFRQLLDRIQGESADGIDCKLIPILAGHWSPRIHAAAMGESLQPTSGISGLCQPPAGAT
jgi:hypothetical protein